MNGDTLIAVLIVIGFALLFYGFDYDLRALLAEQDNQIGAGESTGGEAPGVLPRAGLSATLTTSRSAAGADKPFDWNAA